MAVRKWRWTLVTVVAATAGLLTGCARGAVAADVIGLCRSDANAVETAAQAYLSQVGNAPPSLRALTGTLVVRGQQVGPWLRVAPGTEHYTLFFDKTGIVYVYPPRVNRPASYG